MDAEAKKILSVLGIAAVTAAFVYGTYLPLAKAQTLVNVLDGVTGTITVSQFEDSFKSVLDYPSPVGQYETIKQLNNEITNILMNSQKIPQPISEELVRFAMSYNTPVINSGRALNYAQFLVAAGQLYQDLGETYRSKAYLDRAVAYYNEGLTASPRRPQFLYGLLEIYSFENDKANMKKIGDEILTYWPTDHNVKSMVDKL